MFSPIGGWYGGGGFTLNEKEQEHKLEHGTNQIVDISELKPKLKTSWNQNCKRKLW